MVDLEGWIGHHRLFMKNHYRPTTSSYYQGYAPYNMQFTNNDLIRIYKREAPQTFSILYEKSIIKY